MKKFLVILLTAALACALLPTASAAEYTVTEIVPMGKYDSVGSFSEGLAQVGVGSYPDEKHGFIDKTGKEVVPCKYDNVRDFYEGLAMVGLNDKWGFIDTTGKEVVPCKYDWAWNFEQGFAKVWLDDKCSFIDTTGKEIVPLGKYVVTDNFSEGLASVMDENWMSGYIDTTGKEVIPCKYDSANNFDHGLARVELNGKCGFIDTTGKEVVPIGKYDDAKDFSDGLAKVELNGKRGFIDTTGKEVIPCTLEYDLVEDFDQGVAMVHKDSKFGVIDKTGKKIVPLGKYDFIDSFSEGLAAVTDENWMLGYIDTTGKEVIPCKYDSGEYDSEFHDGLVVVSLDEKPAVIDATGKEIVPPGKYDSVSNFNQGLALVYLNGKHGVIDAKGNEVIPCTLEYNWARPFSEGLAAVRDKNWKWGFISLNAPTANPTPAPVTPAANTAHPSTQTVDVDGKKVEFQCYALKDANGNDTNYIKLRDLADILNGSAAQFEVGWDGNITITTGKAYTKNGTEQNTPFSGQRTYEKTAVKTLVDGKETELDTFQLKDDNGGGYTYYKLRDLGKALGITVDWSGERGIFIETK